MIFQKHIVNIHINILIVRHPDGPQTNEEKEWQERFKKDCCVDGLILEDGYQNCCQQINKTTNTKLCYDG